MGRVIERLKYLGVFQLDPGTKAFQPADGKTLIVGKLSTRIITPGSATNLKGVLYTKGGVKLRTIFDKGSAPAQNEAEKWDAAVGLVLANEDEFRFLAEGADGTIMEAVLDCEELDE